MYNSFSKGNSGCIHKTAWRSLFKVLFIGIAFLCASFGVSNTNAQVYNDTSLGETALAQASAESTPYLTGLTVKQGALGRLDFAISAINHNSFEVEVHDEHSKVVFAKSLPSTTTAFSVANLYPSSYAFSVYAVNGAKKDGKIGGVDLVVHEKNKDYANKFGDLRGLAADRVNSIRWMYRYGIAAGADKYNPSNTVNRGAMAQFMHKLVDSVPSAKKVPAIGDISKLAADRQADIKWLAAEGITVLAGNKYNPANAVNRGAMAEFMYKLAGMPKPDPTTADYSKITDISKLSEPRRKAIAWLAKNEITVLDNGKYNPQNAVNRGAMAQFMQKLYDFVILNPATKEGTETYAYKAYVVNFDANEGTATASIATAPNTTIKEPVHPSKDHWDFVAWCTDKDLKNEWRFATDTVSSNITLYAKWKPLVYTVTFDSNEGSIIAPANVNSGDTVARPTDPTREHFLFVDWYADEELEDEWDFDANIVNNNITLYARWIGAPIALTFDANDDTITPATGSQTAVTANYGAPMPTLTYNDGNEVKQGVGYLRAGYGFEGYYDDKAGGTKYYNTNGTSAKAWDKTDSTILYAHWVAGVFNVTFDSAGGDDIPSELLPIDSKVSRPVDPERPGYAFVGWYKDTSFNTPWDFDNDAIQGNTSIHAKWVDGIKFTFEGEPLSSLTLNANWAPKTMVLCQYSTNSVNYTTLSSKSMRFDPTNELYFKGDCRDSKGTLSNMFRASFKNYTSTVRLDGSVIGIMGNGTSLGTVDNMFYEAFSENTIAKIPAYLFDRINGTPKPYIFFDVFSENAIKVVPDDFFSGIKGAPASWMFSSVFYGNKLETLPENLFSGIKGAPAEMMFRSAFWNNQLTEIPEGFFDGIVGAPKEDMFIRTFTENPKLAKIGDLGMNITIPASNVSVYRDMFKNAGTDPSVTSIELPAGGPVALFTNNPSVSVNSLAKLYTGTTTNEAFGGHGWGKKYAGYSAIPNNWGNGQYFRVSFDSNGGEPVEAQDLFGGSKVVQPNDPYHDEYALVGWYKEPTLTTLWNFDSNTVSTNMTLFAKWTEGIKFTLEGNALTSLTLNSSWNPKSWSACRYSAAGSSFTAMSGRSLTFSSTKTMFFRGDCRDNKGTISYMFQHAFDKYTSTVKLTGGVIGIMGNGTSLNTVDTMFRATFSYNDISEIPADLFARISGTPKDSIFYDVLTDNKLRTVPENLFSGIEGSPAYGMFLGVLSDNLLEAIPANLFSGIAGAPAPWMFRSAFWNNPIAEIPEGLFSGIAGPPQEDMFIRTFMDMPLLRKIGDLGMNITEPTDSMRTYSNMFAGAGTDQSVAKIELPAGGPIALFTEDPAPNVDSLDKLYAGSESNTAFSGLGWGLKYDGYTSIPSTWSNGKLFAVTFEPNEGTPVDTQFIFVGAKVTKPANPSKPGATFVGWYTEPDLFNAWNFETNLVSDNMTLYAKWQ
ncbi:MAG: InlB B-repeat-containing protein [Bifidobacteriaceae bacterium]|jgi:uncharacterized repeat protein (TIGR02543 family)|nr:InlB B-repeat-containing protein [Bifidobacteriaceae bacterium]